MGKIELRLQKFLKANDIKVSEVEKKVGLSNGSLSKHFNPDSNGLSSKYIDNIRTGYPQLNFLWLMSGSGQMLTAEQNRASDGGDRYNIPLSANFSELVTQFPAVAAFDSSGNFTMVNDAFIQKTGWTLKECAGKTPWDLLLPEKQDEKKKEDIQRKLEANIPFYADIEVAHKYGFPVMCKFNVLPVFKDGQVESYLGFADFVSF